MLYNPSRHEMLEFFPPAVDSVLDVGCSTGSFGRTLRGAFPDAYSIGVDPNEQALRSACGEYSDVVLGSFPEVLSTLPAERRRFDVVVFNDVLEHMETPEDALRAAHDAVADGGVVVASVPNVRHLSVIGPLVAQGRFEYRDSGLLDRTHLRFFTRSSVRALFEGCGWEIAQLQGINRGLHVGESRERSWLQTVGRLTRGWTDDFFFVQYGVVARAR